MIRALRILFSAMTFIGLFDDALAQETTSDAKRRTEHIDPFLGKLIPAEVPGFPDTYASLLQTTMDWAANGVAKYQYELATIYLSGAYSAVLAQNKEKGLAYLRRSIAQGYGPAELYGARQIFKRTLTEAELSDPEELLRRSIAGRYGPAVAFEGERRIKGIHAKEDFSKGMDILLESLPENLVYTNFVWGKNYLEYLQGYTDVAPPLNPASLFQNAYIALSLAAGGGHRMAKVYLAQQLIYGLPEKRDPARGIGMLQELLGDEQNRQAYWRLGEAYLRGVGGHLDRDVGKGLDLLTAAAEEGHCGAIHSLIEAYDHVFVDHPDFPTDALRTDQLEALWAVLPKDDVKAAHWRGKQTSCLRNAWDYDEDWWQ